MRLGHNNVATEARSKVYYSPFIRAFMATLIVILSISCSRESEPSEVSDFPEQFMEIENLILISPDEGSVPDTVELIQEAVFESNEDVYIEGYISELAVDDSGRVYIAATIPGTVGIYVFEPDGGFIDKFAREGRGPGEYESITSMQFSNDTIYLFDARLQKFGLYSSTSLSHLKDEVIKHDWITTTDSPANLLRGWKLYSNKGESHILHMRKIGPKSSDIQTESLFKVSHDGHIQPNPLLTVDRFQFYYPPPSDRLELPFPMPFTRSSLVSFTKAGRIITNWTEDFLIRIYNSDGEFQSALYYPVESNSLDMREFEMNRHRERTLSQYEMPETWPAVHTMELDNENRLWVATITESDSTFLWYVIDLNGELLAKFELTGRRTSRSVMSKPLIRIYNGYFYLREQDIRQGIDGIIKYRIEFGEGR